MGPKGTDTGHASGVGRLAVTAASDGAAAAVAASEVVVELGAALAVAAGWAVEEVAV